MAMTHRRITQFSVFDSSRKAPLEGRSRTICFFGVVSSRALAQPKSLAVEISSGHSRRGESAENGVVNGTGIDAIDSDVCHGPQGLFLLCGRPTIWDSPIHI